MRRRLLDFVICPLCGGELALGQDRSALDTVVVRATLICGEGHRFPVRAGVPRLLAQSASSCGDSRSIQDSFSREWGHFDYERDRTWGQTADRRRADFLSQVDLSPQALAGLTVLDAGCGNGVLSAAISDFGCEVVAADIGHQVVEAHRHFTSLGIEHTHYLQADLMRPPFRPGAFDIVFCAGVLHHTPDTRQTLDGLVRAVADGGRIFVWLYHHVPGFLSNLKLRGRPVMAELPAPVKHALVLGLLPQALARQRLRIARGRQDPATRLNPREKLITMLDSFTCRYRWEHTQEEVHGWYRELGFVDIKTTEVGAWGFGVVATRPSAAAQTGAHALQSAV